jgi:hypothetical protein
MRHAGRHNATEALSLNSSYSSVCGHDDPGVKDQMAMCRYLRDNKTRVVKKAPIIVVMNTCNGQYSPEPLRQRRG